jgi:proline iminopeptidase
MLPRLRCLLLARRLLRPTLSLLARRTILSPPPHPIRYTKMSSPAGAPLSSGATHEKPNLRMTLDSLTSLPSIEVAAGYSLRTVERDIIKVVRSGDLSKINELMQAAFGTSHGAWTEQRVLETMWLDQTVKQTFVIEENATRTVVAVASARIDWVNFPKGLAYLHWVGSHPAHRGKNLGRAVSLAVLQYARDNLNCTGAMLETQDERVPAVQVYQAIGFKPALRTEPGMEERWSAIEAQIKEARANKGERVAAAAAAQQKQSASSSSGPLTSVEQAKAAAALRPSTLRTLYPEIEPYSTGKLKVSELHTIYFEEAGNKDGKPIICLHGGPGGGSSPMYRQFFNPKLYRIIQFDQRGSGNSTPFASLEENTTQDLVEDIEKLRKHLGVDRWVVFGGSWGSTLSLAYAQKHVARVKALVLRGIFLLRREELEFFYQEGSSWIFPDAFENYVRPIPEAERGDLITAFHKRLTGENEEEKLKCATAWSVYEMATSRLYVDPSYIERAEADGQFAIAFARIESHYFVNKGFFEVEGQLLRDAHIMKDIPGTIVQGRYDMVSARHEMHLSFSPFA